ncbi:MAG: ligase-associated DNA damage response DEXH box helicase [Chitinophagaceae bacterium]|nr:ligase-associated DNA damage response DEXH box helicase [Chitinophagaceae bacterium]
MNTEKKTPGEEVIYHWLSQKSMLPFKFQEEVWKHIIEERSGMVNAPTGCGKTFSVFLGALIRFINAHPSDWKSIKQNGLQLLWITPLRALAKDIGRAMEEVVSALGMQWQIAVRNGDTSVSERARQRKKAPEVLIITPESLHLLLATKDHGSFFNTLRIIAVDEWHELLGSKRGVQVELALAYLIHKCRESNEQADVLVSPNSAGQQKPLIKTSSSPLIWGISATIGNLDEAQEVLLKSLRQSGVVVKAEIEKKIAVHTIIPDEIEKYPWAGHLGIKLIGKVVPIIEKSKTTLIFINTRGMAERWYQSLLDIAPELAGAIALHHGSIEMELRQWVEEALHTEKLKAVVTTASLDLGVDFRPVDSVIQVGSPKGVARFLQRAGRAGHQPGEVSHIYFLPTHSLELVESAALQQAMHRGYIEDRIPLLLCYDVLLQFLCTLAVGDGFKPEEIFPVLKNTYSYAELTNDEWLALLNHLTEGGQALKQYDEYRKVDIEPDGNYRIKSRRLALRHRLGIGTIVSDAMLKVKFMTGGYIGHIEEWFISRLEPGDAFTLAGRNVELVQVKDMTVLVRKSNSKKTIVPSWMGGRMSLTANLGEVLRETFSQTSDLVKGAPSGSFPIELRSLEPLLHLQEDLSHIPRQNELLIEHHEDEEGYHLLVYPFEGRQIHEALSAILAYRIGKILPISFSIAMNDYGFELLSDKPIPVDDSNVYDLFSLDNLLADMQKSTNQVEMAMRKFRDIAVIGGLIFPGMPGEQKKARHLQASASLLFKVFREFDPENLLLRQAYNEVFEQQMEEVRLRQALQRIVENPIIITFPERLTPLSFPIIVDGLNRNNLTTEKLEDRIRKMQAALG